MPFYTSGRRAGGAITIGGTAIVEAGVDEARAVVRRLRMWRETPAEA